MKKKRKSRKKFTAPSLWSMIIISFLVHLALIYLIPAVDVFPPAEQDQYVELEMTLLEPEDIGEPPGESEEPAVPEESLTGKSEEPGMPEEPPAVIDVPTNLEPVRPEMVAVHNTNAASGLSMPDREDRFEPLQSTGMVSRTLLKPTRSTPNSLAVDFVSVGDLLNKPPAHIERDQLRADALQPVTPDDVTHEAEQPYEDFFKARDVLTEQDAGPEFIIRKTAEIPTPSPELFPRAIAETKTVVPMSPPPVRYVAAQRELAKVVMPSVVTLPESTALPDVDENVIHIDKRELVSVAPQEAERFPVSVENKMDFPMFQATLPQAASERQPIALLAKSAVLNVPKISEQPLFKLPAAKAPVRDAPDSKEIPSSPGRVAMPTPFPVQRTHDQREELVSRNDIEMRMVPQYPLTKESVSFSPPSLTMLTHHKQEARLSQPLAPGVKLVVPEAVSRRSSVEHLLFPPTNIAYADDIDTPAIQPQRPAPMISPTPTPAVLLAMKRPRTLEQNRLMERRDRDIVLFQPPGAAKKGDAGDTGPSTVSLPSNQPTFGISVAKQRLRPVIEEPKKLAQQSDAIQGVVTQTGDEGTVESEIEGPASRREVVYKPLHLPEVSLDMEVELRLKFWVLSDGSIGEVIPLQRGDFRLERAAIQYLKSWRFTPAEDGRKVWGIIPIKYKLQ